ncbi:MAG: hypothetical protein J5845_08515 [Lachnospiraceae bacterium]|nr:hypothetical protein [Lachnospiraceae bacterium]
MSKRTFRLIIIAVCLIAVAAEVLLVMHILGRLDDSHEKAQDQEQQEEEDGEKRYMVKRMVYAKSSSGSLTYEYDSDGRVVKTQTVGSFLRMYPLGSSGKGSTTIHTYQYDAEGNVELILVTGKDVYGEDKAPRQVKPAFGELETDYAGGVDVRPDYYLHMTEITRGSEGSEDYEFDDGDRIISVRYESLNRYSTFEYDQKGNIILRIDRNLDDNGEIRRCIFRYDRNGRMTSAESTFSGKDAIKNIDYFYDANGDLIREEQYRDDGSLYETVTYTYDEDHCMLTEREEMNNGICTFSAEKQYETFYVTEQYLTNEERKNLGLPYERKYVLNRDRTVNPASWELTSDQLLVY